MLKLVRNVSKLVSVVMVVKTGYDIFQTGKDIVNTVSKSKKKVETANGTVSKVLKAVKKGIKQK